MNVQFARAKWHLKENQEEERFKLFAQNAVNNGNLLLNK